MSPKSKEQYEEIRRRSMEVIKEKALELFAHQGYSSTSISKIAREAGVSKGLMYNYFESKEALLHEIILEAIEVMEQLMIGLMEDRSEPREQLRKLTEVSFEMVNENFQYWKLLLALALQPGILEGMKPLLKQKQAESIALISRFFRDMGVEDPEREAYFFGATLDGIFLHYLQLTDLEEAYPLDEMKQLLFRRFGIQ